MKTNKEMEMMLNLERAINALQKHIDGELYNTRSQEAFNKWYAAEALCQALTKIKCSLGYIIDEL